MAGYPHHTWPQTVRLFDEIAAEQPRLALMRAFVGQVAASKYAAGLNPLTSHATLLLSPNDTLLTGYDEVKIDLEDGEFVVRYHGSPTSATWTTRDTNGMAALERFLQHIRWFVEYNRAPPRP